MSYTDYGLVAPTLNDATAAAANVTKIQAALNNGSKVKLVGVGAAYINAPLIIGSNTELDIPKGLSLKLANSANTNLIQNSAYGAAWTTIWNASGSITTGPLALIWGGSISAWAQSTAYSKGNYVQANGNLYWCATAGTSLGSGTGPSGTGSGISDGTAAWNYVTAYTASPQPLLTMVINWPSHGRSVGDAVWSVPQPDSTTRWTAGGAAGQLGGPCDSAYFGVFWVATVNDANFITVVLRRRPAAAFTGIPINIKVANKNIKISGGGTLDYNYANNGSPSTAQAIHSCILGGVYGLDVSDIFGLNSGGNVVRVVGVANWRLRNINHDPASSSNITDRIKVYGPAWDGRVEWSYGAGITAANPGEISLQTQEPAGFATDNICAGDVLNVGIFDTFGDNYQGITIYPSDANLFMDQIVVDGVALHSQMAWQAPVRIVNNNGGTGGTIGRIIFRNIDGRDDSTAANINQIYASGTHTIEKLEIDGYHSEHSAPSFNSAHIAILAGVTVNHLSVRNCRCNMGANAASKFLYVSGTVDLVSFENNYITGVSNNGAIFYNAGTVTDVVLRANEFSAFGYVAYASAAATYTFDSNYINGLAVADVRATGSTFVFTKNQINGATSGLVRIEGTYTVTIKSDGTNVLTGSSAWKVTTSGSPTISCYGWDISVDVTTLARSTGQYCNNSNAAAGTLGAAGLVSCQGTAAGSWTLLGNPTLNY